MIKFIPFLCLFIFAAYPHHGAAFEGVWKGAIEIPNMPLRVEVELSTNDAGEPSGTIAIPAQGLRGFALSAVQMEGKMVHFEMGGIPGTPTFDGELSESGESISGEFTQGPQRFAFSLSKDDGSGDDEDVPEIPEGTPGEGVVGDWGGTLSIGPMELRLALHVEQTEDGGLTGTLDSIDQGAMGIPISAMTYEAESREFWFESNAIGGEYRAVLNHDGSALEGTWTQNGRANPLTFFRGTESVAINRPQEPKAPFPYSVEEVRVENTTDGVTLAGSLLIPEGEGPFPAVVFVSGSGAQDRDETLMGHKPFWVIADHLARNGIASLRYDDRGAGQSTGDHMGSTVDAFARDASSAIDFLAEQEAVDSERIGILGHSEGGLHGPMAVLMNDQIDFLVLLAPPAEPMADLLVRQTVALERLAGVGDAALETIRVSQREAVELIRDSGLPDKELADALRELANEQLAAMSPEELAESGYDSAMIEQNIKVSTTPWFRSLMQIDPAEYLREVTLPTLALFGEKDFQVDPEVNLEALRAALKEAGNSQVEAHILPGLNHLFQRAETGGMDEYGRIEETISPAVLTLISDWIDGLPSPEDT
jgi:hypothetical protein